MRASPRQNESTGPASGTRTLHATIRPHCPMTRGEHGTSCTVNAGEDQCQTCTSNRRKPNKVIGS